MFDNKIINLVCTALFTIGGIFLASGIDNNKVSRIWIAVTLWGSLFLIFTIWAFSYLVFKIKKLEKQNEVLLSENETKIKKIQDDLSKEIADIDENRKGLISSIKQYKTENIRLKNEIRRKNALSILYRDSFLSLFPYLNEKQRKTVESIVEIKKADINLIQGDVFDE